MPTIFDGDQAHRHQLKELETEQEKLYAEIGRLTTQLNWLKKKALTLSKEERLKLIEMQDNDLSISA